LLTSQVQNKVANPKVTQRVSAPVAKTLPSNDSIQSGINKDAEIGQVQQFLKDTSRQSVSGSDDAIIQGKFSQGVRQLKSAPSNSIIQLKTSSSSPVQMASASINKTGLPNHVKAGVEQLSGISLSDVNIHYNSNQPAQLRAHAFAQGTDIHVGPGQEKHVPHEVWHVVQQKQGRVQATKQMKGMVPVNDDAGLEQEADVMGAKAVQMASIEREYPVQQKAISQTGIVQKVDDFEMTDAFDGGKSTFQQENPLLASKKVESEIVDSSNFRLMENLPKLYHTTTKFNAAKNILNRIQPEFFSNASRFGKGFYLAQNIDTTEKEIAHHGGKKTTTKLAAAEVTGGKGGGPLFEKGASNKKVTENSDNEWAFGWAKETIEYQVNGGKILDCTIPSMKDMVKNNPLGLRAAAIKSGFEGIAYYSQRGGDICIVVFSGFESIISQGKTIEARL
jgi:hypothetical protein